MAIFSTQKVSTNMVAITTNLTSITRHKLYANINPRRKKLQKTMRRKTTTSKLEATNQEVISSLQRDHMTTTATVSLTPVRNSKARSHITNKGSSHTIAKNFHREAIR